MRCATTSPAQQRHRPPSDKCGSLAALQNITTDPIKPFRDIRRPVAGRPPIYVRHVFLSFFLNQFSPCGVAGRAEPIPAAHPPEEVVPEACPTRNPANSVTFHSHSRHPLTKKEVNGVIVLSIHYKKVLCFQLELSSTSIMAQHAVRSPQGDNSTAILLRRLSWTVVY